MSSRGLGALACAWAILSGSPAKADTTGCGVSEAALKQVVGTTAGRKWELSTKVFDGPLQLALNVETLRQDFPDADPDDPHVGWFMVGDGDAPVSVKPPSKEMAQSFIEQARVSATACSNVLQSAHRWGIAIEQRAKSRPHRKSDGLYDRSFLQVTKAIISPDGTEALVYVSTVLGPLSGGGRLLLFRQNAGEWSFAGQLPLWVS